MRRPPRLDPRTSVLVTLRCAHCGVIRRRIEPPMTAALALEAHLMAAHGEYAGAEQRAAGARP